MTATDFTTSPEFRERLEKAVIDQVPGNIVLTREGPITITLQTDTRIDGEFSLTALLLFGEGDNMEDFPADDVTGKFSLLFRDANDIPVNAKLTVDVESFPLP